RWHGITNPAPPRVRRVQRRVCRRLSLAGFPRGLRLLPAAFGIRARARRPLQRASSLRRGKAAGFRGDGRLPLGGPAIFRSRAFSERACSCELFVLSVHSTVGARRETNPLSWGNELIG